MRHTALTAAVATVLAASAQAAAPISVVVNGTPVAFAGAAPVETGGAVLVPLRGVFQSLGATVDYDPATRIIHARKGSATVTLPLGSTTATVNGRPQTLGQPAQTVGGMTLVPLRFVAQALGASVKWVAAANTVQIRTDEPHLATLPTSPGTEAVIGQATGVFTDTNPQTLTVRVNGVNLSVPLGPQTVILRAASGQPGTPVPLTQIQPGDQVTVQRDAAGAALSVTATFGVLRGTVKSIGVKLADGSRVLTLNDGTTVELIPDIPITMAGRNVTLIDVMSNEDVVVRTSADNRRGYGLALVTPDDPNPTPPGQPPVTPTDVGAAQGATPSTTPPVRRP